MIFHRAEDASTSSPPGDVVSEGRLNIKPYNHQCHIMMKNMGYNLKRPTSLGMAEGILVPFTSMTKSQKEEFEWSHQIEKSRLGIGFTPYQSMPRVTRNFRAKIVASIKEYDFDDSLEI